MEQEVACPECEGAGQFECYECGGDGCCMHCGMDQNCPSCMGSGSEYCRNCDGSGRVPDYDAADETHNA